MYSMNAVTVIKQFILAATSCAALVACGGNDNSSRDNGGGTAPVLSNSDVDFSNCREIAGGIAVPKINLEMQVPNNLPVNSLTDMGFVFEGSDDMGLLIVRSLSCEAIRVTDDEGNISTDEDVALVHVGTPIDQSSLPATTFSNDGINGADFNIYTFSYQTSSPAYYGAMERAGMQRAFLNEGIVNTFTDLDPDTCSTGFLFVNVPGDSEFGLSISGEVVEATADCHPGGVNFFANWWSVSDENQITALSNIVEGQTFTDTAGPNVFVFTTTGTEISDIIGTTSTPFTGFSGSGYIPSGGLGNQDMVAEALGTLD